jgi:5-formyltetrahydrofolate cyclo-ligase
VNFQNEKSELRKRYRRERSEHAVDTPYLNLLNWQKISTARVIASYISYGDEPNTLELNQAILDAGKKEDFLKTIDQFNRQKIDVKFLFLHLRDMLNN